MYSYTLAGPEISVTYYHQGVQYYAADRFLCAGIADGTGPAEDQRSSVSPDGELKTLRTRSRQDHRG